MTKLISVNTAIQFPEHGLSIFPANPATKAPAISGSWNVYRDRLPTWEEIGAWYDRPNGLAIVCGRGSRNLEGLDFDNKGSPSANDLLDLWRARVERRAPGLYARLLIERTQSGGYHVLYRCEIVEGNQKLAQRPSTDAELQTSPARYQTLIETRGEGGYFITAPSSGYALIQGRFSTIPTLTPEERQILLDEARALTQRSVEPRSTPVAREVVGNRPGDDYNARGNVEDVLIAHGWKLVRRIGDETQWRRPGKAFGISATLNHIPGLFYVFSSNADPFEPERGYNPFSVYAILEHGGDFRAAAKTLRAEGYGGQEDFDREAWANRFRGRPISGNEMQLYSWIQRNHNAGVAIVTNGELAQILDRSERTIMRWLNSLEARGLIRRRQTETGRYIDLVDAGEGDKNILSNRLTDQNINLGGVGGENASPVVSVAATCEQCGTGEMQPDEAGIVRCTCCAQVVPAAEIVNEALHVYGHVAKPSRLEAIEYHVISNGRPDLTYSKIVHLHNLLIAERQRKRDDDRYLTKLQGLSVAQLRRREKSAADRAEKLAREGKRGESLVWSRMCWLTGHEIERRERMDAEQRASELVGAVGRKAAVKQFAMEGLW